MVVCDIMLCEVVGMKIPANSLLLNSDRVWTCCDQTQISNCPGSDNVKGKLAVNIGLIP